MQATVIDWNGILLGLVKDGEKASDVYIRITKTAEKMGKDVSHGIRLIYAGQDISNNSDPIELLSEEDIIAMVPRLGGGGGRLRRRRKSKKKSKRSKSKRKSKRKSRRKSKRKSKRRRHRSS